MKKIITFYRYLCDFIKHREFLFIFTAIKYILFKIPPHKTRIIRTKLGNILSRKGTIDFQFSNYAYEWNVKSYILKRLKDYNVFFDVGANIGTYSILLANKGLKCFAFEPIKDNFRSLQINIFLNKHEQNIRAFNCGLGKDKYKADFIYNTVNTGASHIYNPPEKDGIPETVNIKPLDSIYKSLKLKKDDKILMKVDVEGMEPNVFDGAREFLSCFPYILIIFESKHSDLHRVKEILEEIDDFEYTKVDHYNMATKKLNDN